MLPTLLELGGVAVPSYLVTTCLGYGLGLWWLQRAAARLLSDTDRLVGLYLSLMVAGWLGARVMHIVGGLGRLEPLEVLAVVLRPGGGVAFLGGVLGGTLGAVVYMQASRLPSWKMLDLAAAPLMAGLAVGRVGCTLAGCCHGRPLEASVDRVLLGLSGGEVVLVDSVPFVALVFSPLGHGSIAGVPVYPTQPIEVLMAAMLAGALHRLYRSGRRFDGQVFAAMMGGYGLLRLGVEQLRGDSIRGDAHLLWGLQLSTGELSASTLIALAAAVVVLRWRKPVGPEPVQVDAPEAEETEPDLSDLLE